MLIYKGNYVVLWCQNCDQGWIIIEKEISSQKLFLSCTECLVEWDSPEDLKIEDSGEFGKYGNSENPTFEEIAAKGWDKFILKDYP